jgi:hypothetical protein
MELFCLAASHERSSIGECVASRCLVLSQSKNNNVIQRRMLLLLSQTPTKIQRWWHRCDDFFAGADAPQQD